MKYKSFSQEAWEQLNRECNEEIRVIHERLVWEVILKALKNCQMVKRPESFHKGI